MSTASVNTNTGWKVLRTTLSTKSTDFTDNIVSASIILSGTSASGAVYFDHMKFVKNYTKLDEQNLSARSTASAYASPFITKAYGQSVEVEYNLKVT